MATWIDPIGLNTLSRLRTRRSTVSPVTMHFPGPSYSSTSGVPRTLALNALTRASLAGSSLMCAMTNLPPPFSAVTSLRISSTSSIEFASTVLSFRRCLAFA